MTGWISPTTGETADAFLTRLEALNDTITVSMQCATSLVYSAYGKTLRQKETESVVEVRGVSEAGAELLLDLITDGTTTTIYYANVGTGHWVAQGVTTGSRYVVNSSRANEAGGWNVTIRMTVYEADSTAGWTTTNPGGGTGFVRSVEKRTEQVSYEGGAKILHATITTTEYPFLTSAAADTLVAANNTNTMVYHEATYNHSATKYVAKWNYTTNTWDWTSQSVPVSTHYSWYQGTEKSAVKTFINDICGWTVTVTEKSVI